jgi:hypothetical protein
MTLPMWYIRQQVYPYGARPPKRPDITWVEPAPIRQHGGVRHFQPVTRPDGNLNESEYQFFVGMKWPDSNMAVCRCCNKNFYTKEERQSHFKTKSLMLTSQAGYEPSCAIKIIAIMQLLQKDNNCVVCDTHTLSRKWGFPLCSRDCMVAWMFTDRKWPVFEDARGIALKAGWR